MVSRPNVLSWVCRLLSSVVAIRAPVMPNGWPRAIAPPDRWPQRGRAAGRFQLVRVDAQSAGRAEHLHREGLVDLEQVDVLDRQAGPLQGLLARLDRAQAHDLGGPAAH